MTLIASDGADLPALSFGICCVRFGRDSGFARDREKVCQELGCSPVCWDFDF